MAAIHICTWNIWMRRNYRIGYERTGWTTQRLCHLQAKRKEAAVIDFTTVRLHSSGAHLQQYKYTMAAGTGARNRTTAHNRSITVASGLVFWRVRSSNFVYKCTACRHAANGTSDCINMRSSLGSFKQRFDNIVVYRPVAKQWLCKQRPLIGNDRNIVKRWGYATRF
jgi:hypothetical protein